MLTLICFRPATHGYTLIELMITIAITGILLSAAVPSFSKLIARNNVTLQTNNLLSSLYLARSYAIARQKRVHVCQLAPDSHNRCSGNYDYNSNWSHGWLLFVDNNANHNFDDKDDLVEIVSLPNSQNIVFNQRGRLRFFPDGSARSAGFYLCDKQKITFRHIYLLYSGRARVNQQMNQKQKSICAQPT